MRWKTGVGAALNRRSSFAGEAERRGGMDFTDNREEKGICID
jgi:hypothetical protein